MKLQNKFQDEDFELGEVVDAYIATMPDGRIKLQAKAKKGGLHTIFYDTLEELNGDWEDYEEPEGAWFIDCDGNVVESELVDGKIISLEKQAIGNFFTTKEQAKKAVEKLKAWKRMKDKGFKVDLWDYDGSDGQGRIRTGRILFRIEDNEENDNDLDLLFGGEE